MNASSESFRIDVRETDTLHRPDVGDDMIDVEDVGLIHASLEACRIAHCASHARICALAPRVSIHGLSQRFRSLPPLSHAAYEWTIDGSSVAATWKRVAESLVDRCKAASRTQVSACTSEIGTSVPRAPCALTCQLRAPVSESTMHASRSKS